LSLHANRMSTTASSLPPPTQRIICTSLESAPLFLLRIVPPLLSPQDAQPLVLQEINGLPPIPRPPCRIAMLGRPPIPSAPGRAASPTALSPTTRQVLRRPTSPRSFRPTS